LMNYSLLPPNHIQAGLCAGLFFKLELTIFKIQ